MTIIDCVDYYRNQWITLEKPIFDSLQEAIPEQQRMAALRSLCGKYSIARI